MQVVCCSVEIREAGGETMPRLAETVVIGGTWSCHQARDAYGMTCLSAETEARWSVRRRLRRAASRRKPSSVRAHGAACMRRVMHAPLRENADTHSCTGRCRRNLRRLDRPGSTKSTLRAATSRRYVYRALTRCIRESSFTRAEIPRLRCSCPIGRAQRVRPRT